MGQWFVSCRGETTGPVSDTVMAQWAREHRFEPGTFVRRTVDARWMPLEQSPFAAAPAEASVTAAASPAVGPAKSEWRGALIAVGSIVGGAAVLWFCGTALIDRSGAGADSPSISRPISNSPPAVSPDEEAQDTVRVLGVYFRAGQDAGKASWDWAECHDRARGYTKIVNCTEVLLEQARDARSRLPAEPIAHTSCAKEVEAAHRTVIEATPLFFEDVLSFLKTHERPLSKVFGGRTIQDKFADPALKELPQYDNAKYAPAGYQNVMAIECTKTLFICGQANNVCWVNKVAARLGLTRDENCDNGSPACALYVRATGNPIHVE